MQGRKKGAKRNNIGDRIECEKKKERERERERKAIERGKKT